MKKLYIIGAGSVGGHVALNINEYSDEFEVAGFLDDDPNKIGTEQFGSKVIGEVEDVLKLKEAFIVIGIAFPDTKRKILDKISKNSSLNYPTFIHSHSWVSQNVSIGKGCIIYPGTTINYGSELDDFVVLNMNCALGHHTKIGTYSSLAPGVNTGGHTVIEEGVDVGIGTSTLQNVRIGGGSVVGGQSMVTRDVAPASKVVGIPAKAMV